LGGKIIAYAIAGHHAGLPDGNSYKNSSLLKRLDSEIPPYSDAPCELLKDLPQFNNLPFSTELERYGIQCFFFIRMIYSSLVDADFLDTEAFIDKEKSEYRKGWVHLSALEKKLFEKLDELSKKDPEKDINSTRAEILENCLSAATSNPGLFSLTVPTGGGKTLSSFAFALNHALKHGLDRIIYVIPYTSIIEQNAQVFRGFLGENAVLEHHSNFDPFRGDKEDRRNRLASENWDAPVVVTTNVQFFESLFAARSSRCRKVHNIARSVVILDEAQMLPVSLLKPCLEALKELSSTYSTTILLCTATQPALTERKEFKGGLKKESVREIIPDSKKLYQSLKRVHAQLTGRMTEEEVANELLRHRQALCIVNTRGEAKEIFRLVKEEKKENIFHLSASMCPLHRTKKIREIKSNLKDEKPCLVISTQLIEAGVDVDFPVVYRAMAGIDSIAQAAGRCNREGTITEGGMLYVFKPENGIPDIFKRQAQIAETVMRHHEEDFLSIEAVEDYFRELYWLEGARLDEHGILKILYEGRKLIDIQFREIAEKFTLIPADDFREPLFILWKDEIKRAEKILSELRYSDNPAAASRKAQPFTIQATKKDISRLAGAVETVQDRFHVLINSDLYDDDMGLSFDDPTWHKPESLIG